MHKVNPSLSTTQAPKVPEVRQLSEREIEALRLDMAHSSVWIRAELKRRRAACNKKKR